MPHEHAGQIRTFIYGSCVSRDTFEYLDPHHYLLSGYVARQSLISAFGGATAPFVDLRTLSSDFQRRMLIWDAESALPGLVREIAPHVDLILWDLFDERLGVWQRREGGVATQSVEVLAADQNSRRDTGARLLAFGTEEHRARWQAALRAWGHLLQENAVLEKVVLLAPPWAEKSSSGGASPRSYGRTAAEANKIVSIYVSHAQDVLGCPVVTMRSHEARSDIAHKWGEAPFHYVSANYASLAAGIDSIAGSLR